MLVLGLERRPDDAGRRVVDEHVERPEGRDLLLDARGGDVAAHEHRLGAERAELLGRLLGRRVRAEVADRDASTRPSRARRSAIALPIPRDPPVTRTRRPGRLTARRAAAGRDAVAEDGISSQPIRSRDSGSAFSAFVDAYPSRSSSSIFSSP